MFLTILRIILCAVLLLLSYAPLKETSEYRFTKKGLLAEGLFYLACAITGLVSGSFAWPIAGLAVAGLVYAIRNKR